MQTKLKTIYTAERKGLKCKTSDLCTETPKDAEFRCRAYFMETKINNKNEVSKHPG